METVDFIIFLHFIDTKIIGVLEEKILFTSARPKQLTKNPLFVSASVKIIKNLCYLLNERLL